jgi:hypothetical protein
MPDLGATVTGHDTYGVRLVSIRDASERTGLQRTRLNALLDCEEIASVKLLDRRLVVVTSLEHFIERQRERSATDKRVRVPPGPQAAHSRKPGKTPHPTIVD